MARLIARAPGTPSPEGDKRASLSPDGLGVSASNANAWLKASTNAYPLGKVYYEVVLEAASANAVQSRFGFVYSNYAWAPPVDFMSIGLDLRGYPSHNNQNQVLLAGASSGPSDVLMLAKDEVGRFWAGKNGSWFAAGDPATGLNPLLTANTGDPLTMVPACALYTSNLSEVAARFRFAAAELQYPVPSGFGLVEDAPTEPFTPARLGDLVTVGRSEIEPVKIGHLGRLIDAVPGGVVYGGRGRIKGTVKVAGTPHLPVRRRVRLMAEMTGHCVAETWSDALTGDYAFEHLSTYYRYTVISYDHTGTHRAVVADHLTPEPMP